MVKPPYAWPHHDAAENEKSDVIVGILAASFNQSGTKIKDGQALLSAARHITRSDLLTVELGGGPSGEFPPLSTKHSPPYAWPSPFVGQEQVVFIVYQVLKASFDQSSTKVKNDDAVLSAARHVSQSKWLNVAPASDGRRNF